MAEINWDDPVERAGLIERVGPTEYNRLFEEHRAKSVVAVENGYKIRPVPSRFGRLYQVDGTGKAFITLQEARTFAQGLDPK